MGKVIFGLLVGTTLGFMLRMVVVESRAGESTATARDTSEVTREDGDASASARRPEAAPAVGTPPFDPRLDEEVDEGAGVFRDGTLSGVVLSERGEPIAGARVRARPALSSLSPDVRESAEDFAARAFRRARHLTTATRETTSDADGRYRMTGLERGVPHDVEVESIGWRFLARRAGTKDPIPDARLDFTGTRAGRLVVEVRHTDGTLARSATIWVDDSGDRTFSYRWTPEHPAFPCPLGVTRLRAMVGTGQQSPKTDYFVRAGEQTLSLTLDALRSIEGSIDITGPWPSGVMVRTRKIEDGLTSVTDRELLRGRLAGVETKRGHSFVFQGLSPGRHAVAAYDRNFERRTEIAFVDVPTEGSVSCRLTGLAPDTSGLVRLRALGAEGDVVWNLEVNHLTSLGVGGGPVMRSRLDVQRDGVGDVFLPRPVDEAWSLEVRSQSYGTRFVRVAPGDTEVEVRFDEPAWAWVDILTSDGSPIPRLAVEIEVEVEGLGARVAVHTSVVDGEGPTRIGPIAPGRRELRVSRAPGAGEIMSLTVDLGPGDNAVEVALPPLGRIVASFPGAEVGAWVNLSRRFDDDQGWEPCGAIALDAERRATFTRLAPNSYMVMLGDRWATVDVSTGETSEITVPPATDPSGR